MLHGKNIVVAPAPRVHTQHGFHAPTPVRNSQRPVVLRRCNTTETPVETQASGSGPDGAPKAISLVHTSAVAAAAAPLPEGTLRFEPLSDSEKLWTNLRLAFALPWRRFKDDSVLTMKLEGSITDQMKSRFDSGSSVPQICSALRKAALDPRVKGIAVEIGPLAIGWARIQEIRRYINYFRESGKFTVVYMTRASSKEYYLASAFEEIYMPESASLSLSGFAVTGTFLRGVLDKVGVEPQVKRIGKYKSAGDQLLRKDMSEPQAEQLQAILDDIHSDFVTTVAAARGKTEEEVIAMMEEGIFDQQKFLEGGWLTGLRYSDEVMADMRKRTGGKVDELRSVTLAKYSKVSPSAFGLKGKKQIVVLRTSGAIVGGGSGSGTITTDALVKQLRALGKDKKVSAVVLRVDSPGGDALASDLMWREIKKLGEKKPVVASMGDVAASGGYYLSMACAKILAEPLTITGSVGVVTGKFNLAELYEKIGYSKTILSKGRYAELLADNRSFNPIEKDLFDRAADFAYESFRNKAAASRGLTVEAMQEVAQGRVWSGIRALDVGLVDALGGVHRAVAVAKQLAKIPEDEMVSVLEMGRVQLNPITILTGGGASASSPLMWIPALIAMAQGQSMEQAVSSSLSALSGAAPFAANSLKSSFSASVPQLSQFQQPRLGVQCLMTDVDAGTVGGLASPVGFSGSSDSFLDEEEKNPLASAFDDWVQGL